MPTSLEAASLTSFFKLAPRVAVIGAQGIGRFHARLLAQLGCDVAAICCSSVETAHQCATALEQDFGIKAAPHHQLEDVLALDLDGVSICTPPSMHYDHVLACLDRGLPVFCEKPLMWDANDSLDSVKRKLETLRNHPKRRIFVNTSNVYFLELAKTVLKKKTTPRTFEFFFYTQGPHTYQGIACDLFPHALSFVLKLFGNRTVANFDSRAEEHRFTCSFDYGEAKVSFDLREIASGPKSLSFSIDGQLFNRVQEGFGPTYKVFLENFEVGRIEAEDPFKVYLSLFVRHIMDGALVTQDSFAIDAQNLEIMAMMLLPLLH